MKINGGCLCGQVRFKADAEPLFQAVCHCKNCQKQGGTAFSVVVGVPTAALSRLTGDEVVLLLSSGPLLGLPDSLPPMFDELYGAQEAAA